METKKNETNFVGFSRRKFIGAAGLLLAGTGFPVTSRLETELVSQDEEPIIDIHQHTDYNGRDNHCLVDHQRTMGATTTILLPAGRPYNSSTTHNGESNGLAAGITGNKVAYEFSKQHKGFLFGANEVPDHPNAIKTIEKYLKKGAVVIGEQKFGIDCDAPQMQRIYELAQEYNVPVILHWQFQLYNYGIDRFHTMLEKYPRVNFIGHAQSWWSFMDKNYIDAPEMYPPGKITPGGLTDRLLADYPNMYGDLSAASGYNMLTRDEEMAKNILVRHQNKLMFGSDCPDPAGFGTGYLCQGIRTINQIRKLASNRQIERKILYENAKNLFRI